MSDFASQAETILADGNGEAAVTLLTDGELDGAGQDMLDKLVRLAIDGQEIGGFYPRVIGLVSPEVQQEMNADVGGTSESDIVIEVMQDENSAPHRDAIMRAFIESADGDAMATLFAETASLVSEEVRADMVQQLAGSGTDIDELVSVLKNDDAAPYLQEIADAIAGDGEWDNDYLAQIIREAGHCLDDATLLIIARAMQDEERQEEEAATVNET